jgi:predicted membrane-bound mannosyltransferase
MNLGAALKPRDEEVLALAEKESTPDLAGAFRPICRGPVFAVVALAVVGVVSIPGMVLRLIKAAAGANPHVRSS